jgi:ornithine cyclodeaminase
MNGSAVTAIRTAAVTGAASQALSRRDAGVLALIGAGHQALPHLEALSAVRQLKEARIAARRIENAERFVRSAQPKFSFPLIAAESGDAAAAGADIIVALTTSKEPVLHGGSIDPGAHVNLVGASQPHAREADVATMTRSTLFVDRRESTVNESGDYLAAAREGLVAPENLIELGDVLIGRHPGRSSDVEITLFKSLGLAIEDLAAAAFLLRRARAEKVGTWVPF